MAAATSTAILIGAGLSAAVTSYFGKASLDDARSARRKQEALESDRRKQLATEAAAREAAATKAASAGQRVGRGGARASLLGGLGFGSGDTGQGLGGGNLFGG